MAGQSEFLFNRTTQDLLHKNLKFKIKIGGQASSTPQRIPQLNWDLNERMSKPTVHVEGTQLVEPIKTTLPTMKRNLELDHQENPDFSHNKKLMTIPMEDGNGSTEKGKAAMAEDEGDKSALKQFPCSICQRVFDSHFALGGHKACHEKEDFKLWRFSSLFAPLPKNGKPEEFKPVPPPKEEEKDMKVVKKEKTECPWCYRNFANRFGLAAHSRFCHWKKERMVVQRMVVQQMVVQPAAAAGRNLDFDLNQPPPEA